MAQTVLVIDESAMILRQLDRQIDSAGVRFDQVLDADAGFARACETRPDLILLNVSLPAADGFELCRRLKETSATKDTPVILLSDTPDVVSKVRGLDLGAMDFVTQPFDESELAARVRSALRMKRCHDLLAERAMVDGLTGLWNRSSFDHRMIEELSLAKRHGREFSLVLIDIDHFKRINDSLGHPFGDEVLQSVGQTLLATARLSDVPCRYGGEEFAVILRETPGAAAMIAAERLRSRLASLQFPARGRMVTISASFGVASNLTCGDVKAASPKQLVAAADRALYQAKRTGRNRVCLAETPAGSVLRAG